LLCEYEVIDPIIFRTATNKIRPTRFNSMMTEDYIFNKYVIINCNAYGILVGKRPVRRPRRRWVDNIKLDLRVIGQDCMDWIR
jgi:hypothetical protein